MPPERSAARAVAAPDLVDVHAHLVTRSYVAQARRAGIVHPDGMPAWPTWDARSHLRLMDDAGIQRSLLSVSSPGVHFGDDTAAAALAREVNDVAAAAARERPDRFGLLASLPLPDVPAAVAEAARCLDELGAAGVILLTRARDLALDDERMLPLLEALDRRRALVLVHPTSLGTTPPPGLPAPVLEFPVDTTRTVLRLVLAGLTRRFPALRWVVPHCGGALPVLADRAQDFLERLPARAVDPDPVDVPALLRELWYDTAGSPLPRHLPALAALVGTDRIVYGSDHCWTPAAAVRRQTAALGRAPDPGTTPWRTVLARNARALLARGADTSRPVPQERPVDIDETAPVITRDEIAVRAPLETVWRIQTDVAGWPTWRSDVDRAEGARPLTPGGSFRWSTAGLDITSTVHEIDPPHRVVWGGPAAGITGVHVWTLDDTGGGVLVRTRESWSGVAVDADPAAMQAALDASLRRWLQDLRRTAEADAGATAR